ncbi:MAG: GIY-YIG nuclease family protein [Bacteroidales bacterium]|nr:GIY-YIG nuclease family protein [Candidatus Scybalousia scybalohippi]
MTVGIYKIENKLNNKVYIGKSINIEMRFINHKSLLNKDTRSKDCNRHLYNAVKKNGIDNFNFEIIEDLSFNYSEEILIDRELYWMEFYNSCDRDHGYNLRKDSSSKCIVHEETRKLLSLRVGELNSNFGNTWSDDQKKNASEIQKRRHKEGFYGDEWISKLRITSSNIWKDEEKKLNMAKKVSEAKSKYRFYQYSKYGELLFTYESINELCDKNPSYHIQSIYSVCSGYKKSYKGFIFKKELKES